MLEYATPEALQPSREAAQIERTRSRTAAKKFNGCLLAAILVPVVLFLSMFAWYGWHVNRSSKVADIPGPPGSTTKYELWYALNGNLEFREQNDRYCTVFIDYYPLRDNEVSVARVEWPSNDRVVIRMHDDTDLDIRIRKLSSNRSAPGRPATRNIVP